jgi:hypothetical protein
MSEHRLWTMSAGASVALLAILVTLWGQMNDFERATSQLTSLEEANEFLETSWESRLDIAVDSFQPTIKVPTGVFIQSIAFFDSSEVNISGYIWQKFRDGVHDAIKPGPGEVGFLLPEQVDAGSDIEPIEAYRLRQDDEEVIGWYFEATLREQFDYSTYPFDDKTVDIELWSNDFSRNVILVPDFESYDATGLDDVFGIDEDIVMGSWERQDTFFDYKLSSYSTDFGINNYVGQKGFPELQYNFVIKRTFGDAFIIHVLPLVLVAALLFATLLTVSADDELTERHAFSTSGFIAASSALFFVVLLGHIQLREQFSGSGIVYIEYFYILMYVYLVAATASTFLFSTRAFESLAVVHYKDSIIPKTCFWPLLLSSLIVITLFVRQ